MKIAETLLPKLNEWEANSPGRQQWSQTLPGTEWSLHLEADRVDTLGCMLWEATLTRVASRAAVTNEALRRQATRLADRATGLMEPLRFLELDETRSVALLRSESPAQRGDLLSYYEVTMTTRQIVVKRYHVKPESSGKRSQVAFALTHEAIAKLVDDLVRE
jgi:hypothetical protein